MTRMTKKQAKLDPRVAGFMQYLSEAGVDLGEAKGKAKIGGAKGKGKPAPSEAFVGQAELVEALRVHYALSRADRFEESELANASYRDRGKANLRNLMLTWGDLNKQPSVTKFVGNKDSKTLKRTWWSKHDIK